MYKEIPGDPAQTHITAAHGDHGPDGGRLRRVLISFRITSVVRLMATENIYGEKRNYMGLMRFFDWELSVGIFGLGSLDWSISLGIVRLGPVRLGSFRLGSFRLGYLLGIFRLGSSAWDLSLGTFHLEALAWEL